MVSVDTDSRFAAYFKPTDLSLLSNLRFRTADTTGSKMLHGLPDNYDFSRSQTCGCGEIAEASSYTRISHLLDSKAMWAPCILSAPVDCFVFGQLKTLSDASLIFADLKSLEEFMSEEVPSFDQVLSAARKMIGIATLTHSLGNVRVNRAPGLAIGSLISEHIKTLLISNFRDEILNFFELKSPNFFEFRTSSGPTSNFILVDSNSRFDAFSKYFLSLNPQGDPPMPLDDFNRNIEHMLGAYLLEIIQLNAFVAQVDFTFISGSASILKASDTTTELILRETSDASKLYSVTGLDQESLATFSSLVEMFATKAEIRFRSNKQLVAEVFKPALSAFKAVK